MLAALQACQSAGVEIEEWGGLKEGKISVVVRFPGNGRYELYRAGGVMVMFLMAGLVAAAAVIGLNLEGAEGLIAALVAAGIAVLDFVVTRVRAWRVRQNVTPVDSPVDREGRALTPGA